jgi:heptosyltransferase III
MGIYRQAKSIERDRAQDNVLVLRAGGLGDFILALPVLTAIRYANAEAMIELVGNSEIAELGLGRYYLNRVSSIHESRFARLFGQSLLPSDPALTYLSNFDMVISFLGTLDSPLADNLSSMVDRVIFLSPPVTGAGHVCSQFLAQLSGLLPDQELAAVRSLAPRVFLDESDLRAGRDLLARAAPEAEFERIVAIHPGSGSARKNWPAEHFAAVAAWFQDHQFEVILIQGEADEASVERVKAAVPTREFRVLKDLRVIEAAQALSACRLLIGNDSGISHLAASVGTPIVAVFVVTDPAVWRPRGSRVAILTSNEATPQLVVKEALALL